MDNKNQKTPSSRWWISFLSVVPLLQNRRRPKEGLDEETWHNKWSENIGVRLPCYHLHRKLNENEACPLVLPHNYIRLPLINHQWHALQQLIFWKARFVIIARLYVWGLFGFFWKRGGGGLGWILGFSTTIYFIQRKAEQREMEILFTMTQWWFTVIVSVLTHAEDNTLS